MIANFDSDGNLPIDRFLDPELSRHDWRDYVALRTDSPDAYRRTVATLGKILAKKITFQLDDQLAALEDSYADF